MSGFSRQNFLNLPNLLTYLRIAIIPLILYFLNPPVSAKSYNFAFLLFVLASITDYLDGILARRHNLVTSVGKLLDPLADKLLTSAVLIMLIASGKVQGWLVFLIIGREITITGLRSIAASQGLILYASRTGKNKLISQTVGLLFLLLYIPKIGFVLDWIGVFFLWASVVLGYWSAMAYFVYFYKEVTKQEQNAR
ncbi:CDP-diacylglycerol--glycerol-3-phosphate 3-phosphatidyltransferase [Desulfoferrobacter suflitae]|uniref:CDP-diacylglycerol--glycerol-3-phosphate 3-phosphatidyltransferase n=1 Tax=Desulfoferrobacter suflitae TaxID=2865782 RepID=UPI0021640B22|nr:CDP-diacylglycerol--glycerol-3-phosphate 3-phosphatidyltransferase [Desulfoferrobacter suflitae]MCK8601315.1 CDP-diacylglycerol--glycerol-3-phosphate 3-phosphatidyltransferase [Desulfoferrobacter suflitae]